MMMANAFSECHGKAYERLVRQEELILDVTERLTVELLQAGVTKAELARRLGRTPGFVSQVFGGGRNLTLRTISDIAVALSVRPSFELTPDRGPATDTAWELISVKERRPKPWVAVAPPSPAGVQGPHGDEALPAAA